MNCRQLISSVSEVDVMTATREGQVSEASEVRSPCYGQPS
jgi:hypothetical protein